MFSQPKLECGKERVNQTQVAGVSLHWSNYWATTTHDHQSFHIQTKYNIILFKWYRYAAVSHPTVISVCHQNTDRKQFSLQRRATLIVSYLIYYLIPLGLKTLIFHIPS